VQSMGDLFHEKITDWWIGTVFATMLAVPQHTYITLTKRAERQAEYWRQQADVRPRNLITGVTCCTQEELDRNVPILLDTPAACRMVSIEPMLEEMHIADTIGNLDYGDLETTQFPDWIVCGGESGPGARRMSARWPANIRDECQEYGIPFFFKQWGGVNKKKAGRKLDGQTYDQFPELKR